MPNQLTPKEKSWLQMLEMFYRARLRDHRFLNALIGRHPILYPALGLAIGLAVTLLLPPLAARFGMNQSAATIIAVSRPCVGGTFIVFGALLLLIGLVDWAWNQVRLIFRQR